MDLILPRKLVSRMVLPTNRAGKMTLSFIFSSSLIGVLGGGSPFLIIGIIILVPLFLTSRLLRILWLCGLHRIHVIGLRRDYNSLSISAKN